MVLVLFVQRLTMFYMLTEFHENILNGYKVIKRTKSILFFDVLVLFHLLAVADKIYGNHCAPWAVEILIKYAFPGKWGAIW